MLKAVSSGAICGTLGSTTALGLADPGLDAHLDDPAGFAAQYMAVLEAAVREAPDQYLWVHRRFKTRPPGEGSPYAR